MNKNKSLEEIVANYYAAESNYQDAKFCLEEAESEMAHSLFDFAGEIGDFVVIMNESTDQILDESRLRFFLPPDKLEMMYRSEEKVKIHVHKKIGDLSRLRQEHASRPRDQT